MGEGQEVRWARGVRYSMLKMWVVVSRESRSFSRLDGSREPGFMHGGCGSGRAVVGGECRVVVEKFRGVIDCRPSNEAKQEFVIAISRTTRKCELQHSTRKKLCCT